jgi:hypothetical protein
MAAEQAQSAHGAAGAGAAEVVCRNCRLEHVARRADCPFRVVEAAETFAQRPRNNRFSATSGLVSEIRPSLIGMASARTASARFRRPAIMNNRATAAEGTCAGMRVRPSEGSQSMAGVGRADSSTARDRAVVASHARTFDRGCFGKTAS